ncbi:unnamed protein product [Mucor hiemalis]
MSTSQDDELSASFSASVDNLDDSWVPKIKRRRRFTVDETRVLENEFKKNSSPNQEKIQRIANKISTPRKIVTTWFQNRRAKNKRREKLKREEGIEATKKSDDYEVESYKNSSSQVTDDESFSGDEVCCKGNYDDDSWSDHYDKNVHDLDQHNSHTIVQQQSLMSIEDFNPEVDLPSSTSMVSQPFYTVNNYSSPNFNRPDIVNPATLHLPYGQHYNINIYNNMSSHFISQEHMHDSLSETSFVRQNSNVMNYQNYLNMFYCQQQFSPYFMNNANFPSQSASSSSGSNVNESICINPNDIFLNYFPQYRIQHHQQHSQVREEEINEDGD